MNSSTSCSRPSQTHPLAGDLHSVRIGLRNRSAVSPVRTCHRRAPKRTRGAGAPSRLPATSVLTCCTKCHSEVPAAGLERATPALEEFRRHCAVDVSQSRGLLSASIRNQLGHKNPRRCQPITSELNRAKRGSKVARGQPLWRFRAQRPNSSAGRESRFTARRRVLPESGSRSSLFVIRTQVSPSICSLFAHAPPTENDA